MINVDVDLLFHFYRLIIKKRNSYACHNNEYATLFYACEIHKKLIVDITEPSLSRENCCWDSRTNFRSRIMAPGHHRTWYDTSHLFIFLTSFNATLRI